MGVDIGRVGAWATDFEKLLSDPVGLRTFTVSTRHVRGAIPMEGVIPSLELNID